MGRKHPLYDTWYAMKRRCLDPTHVAYDRYGGKGITICERWLTLSHFVDDMGDRPEGMTLERIDSSLGYSPENCKWATRQEQADNRGPYRPSVYITYDGETLSVRQWAEKLGTTERAIWRRYQRFTSPLTPAQIARRAS